MIKNILVLAGFVMLFSLWGKGLQAQFGELDVQASDNPVVIELFTSQSCSSCPPADKVLGELAKHDNVIALSCHVTYWNHLHWKDTLSHEFCTTRQRSYSKAMNSRRVYTPQMVVNGTEEFIGSRKVQAGKEVSKAGVSGNVQPILISQNARNIQIYMPALLKTGNYMIWVMGYKNNHTQSVKSGENRGRTVTYTNSVSSLSALGSWNGGAETRTLKKPNDSNIDGITIIAQSMTHGPVVAAGKIEF